MEAAAKSGGVSLYDLEYLKEGGNNVLRLYIDKEGGVDLNDCERVSRAAETLLDERDPIPGSYVLEVSSPGVERRLRKESHYESYLGSRVEVRLFAPQNGKKKYRGTLNGISGGVIYFTDENGAAAEFKLAGISMCRLLYFD